MAGTPRKQGFSLKRIFAVAALGLMGLASPVMPSHDNAKSSAGPAAPQTDAQAVTGPVRHQTQPNWKNRLTGRDIVPGDPQAQPLPAYDIVADPFGMPMVVPADTTPRQSSDQIWRNIVGGDNSPYKPFMANGGGETLPPGSGAVNLQLESSYPEVQGLLLSPAYSPLTALERHGGAATGIFESTADKYSRHDVNVLFLDRRDSLESWFLNQNNPETQALLDHAAVLSLSMAFVAKGNPANQTVGSLTTDADIDQACALWQNSHTLLVWSAGNNGTDPVIDLERPAAFHTMCADTLVRVGEAETDSATGDTYIEIWSSRPASFVMKEPFQDGYKYKYFRDGDDARQYLNQLFAAMPAGDTRTNGQIFDDKISHGFFDPAALRSCHPDFNHASFDGKGILKKDKAWMQQHPSEVRAAFTSCLVSAAEAEKRSSGADRNGMVGGKRGTSFSGPTFAGLAAAAHDLYPQLSEYDLTAAALMAARPIDKVRRADGHYNEITYHDNGRGLRHNAYAGGFGLLDPDDYMRMVERMAAMQAADPSLATRQDWIRSANVTFSAPDEVSKSHNDYHITVTDDVGVLQTILKMKFAGGENGVPAKITLINPQGAAEEISPTKVDGEMAFSLANTLGNFGNHARGTWTIRVPSNVKIEQAQLIIPGFQSGGLIDHMLERVTGHPARVIDLPAPVPTLAPPPRAGFQTSTISLP
jgi:hypothetical protein